tara:strand:- start:23288 stop:23506 length:219 start_codon:yes stop_codon:yes gene_type:complete
MVGRKRIPREDAIVVNRIRFDTTDEFEGECARFLHRADPRKRISRMKRLILLGYQRHREILESQRSKPNRED